MENTKQVRLEKEINTKVHTFWSPKRICRRELRDTFIRHRKIRESPADAFSALAELRISSL